MIKSITNSSFVKNVSTLSFGTISANLITVGASLFLTRLYSPGDIGDLTLFISFTIVLANIFTLGYELAIVHPEKDQKATSLTIGIFSLLLILSTFLFAIITLFNLTQTPLDIGIPEEWQIYLPFAILLLGIINISQEWFNRQQSYKLLSIGKVIQSSFTALPQIAIGYIFGGNTGLLIGFVFGRISSSIIYISSFIKNKTESFGKIKAIKDTLSEYKRYPKYISPTLILDRISLEAPFFLIPLLFTDSLLGFFAIAYRVLSVPLSFLGTALGQVFFKHLTSKRQRSEKLTPSLVKIWIALAIVGTIPMGIILIGGGPLFEFVFGDDWGYSGIIAVYLVPMLFIDFISSPTGRTFLVLELEHYTPFFSVARIIYISGSLYLGFVFDDFLLGIVILSITRALALIIQNIILYLQIKRHDLKNT